MKKVINKYSVLINNLEKENKIKSTVLDNTNGNMYILIEKGNVDMCKKEKKLLNLEFSQNTNKS